MTDGPEFKASRRAVLWTGVAALAAMLLPARAGAQPKIAPKLVQYQEKPKGPQECARRRRRVRAPSAQGVARHALRARPRGAYFGFGA